MNRKIAAFEPRHHACTAHCQKRDADNKQTKEPSREPLPNQEEDELANASDPEDDDTPLINFTVNKTALVRRDDRSEEPALNQGGLSVKRSCPEPGPSSPVKKLRKGEACKENLNVKQEDGIDDSDSDIVYIRSSPPKPKRPTPKEEPELGTEHAQNGQSAPAFFLDLPELWIAALKDAGISNIESLRSSRMKEKDVEIIVQKLGKKHGFSDIQQMVAIERICEVIR